MLRSCSPNMNHDGSSLHSGRSPEDSWRASRVTGRCVAAIRAARGAGTSAANWWWKRAWGMNRSVVPSQRGTGRSASPSVLPGNFAASVLALSPGSGAKPAM
jgi:pimeloyl-ACP methyl ester carboxylesterase